MTAPFVTGDLLKTGFVDRPNQFLVRCRLANGRLVRAFLPNPGRMWELLFPGVAMYLTENRGASSGAVRRKTRYTAVAVERDGDLVFLHTGLTNAVARRLIESGRIPSLAGAEIAGSEVRAGRSRFDFLLSRGGRELYLEVKSCTLYGNRVAMFPDAVTSRGRRHLLELAELSRSGVRPVVLFVVHTPRADWFMPDYHSDLAFSRTLLEVREAVDVLAAAVSWRPGLSLGPRVRELEIPWEFLDKEVDDRGSYFVLLHLARRHRLQVGQLGAAPVREGALRVRRLGHGQPHRQAGAALPPAQADALARRLPAPGRRRGGAGAGARLTAPGMRAGTRPRGDHGSGRAGVRILRLRLPLPPVPQRGGSPRPPGFPRAAAALSHAQAWVIAGFQGIAKVPRRRLPSAPQLVH